MGNELMGVIAPMRISPEELKKKILGQLNQILCDGAQAPVFSFFKSSSGRIQCAAKAEDHRQRREWKEFEGWPQNRRGRKISGCSSQTGREKTELKLTVMGRKITITNREPHCSCRVVMVIFIEWSAGSKVTVKTYILTYFSISPLPLWTSTLCPHCHF